MVVELKAKIIRKLKVDLFQLVRGEAAFSGGAERGGREKALGDVRGMDKAKGNHGTNFVINSSISLNSYCKIFD